MSLVWENRQTMLFQIQEMLRVEHIRNEDAIRHEIDTYNDLVPGPNELKATLYIEYEDKDERALMLSRFRTLPGSVYLDIGERSYKAAFKQQDGEEDDRLPAVNYLRFGLDPQSRSALAAAETKVALRVTHPNYAQTAILSDDSKKALSHDLLQE
ncbi:MAG: DUF3501 family protein [Myxococcales bacterium]|nr:MAG: DUF3501 family protein [Myxococcales bacterium]